MKLSNLIARAAAAAISIGMIACTEPAAPPPDPQAAEQVGEAEALPHTLPPPSATTPRYVGLWATTQAGCESPAWLWEANSVSTEGEVSCDFNNVTLTDTGYAIAASCTAEGVSTTHNMQISFAESARAMMVSNGPWQGPTSLVYCGALPPE